MNTPNFQLIAKYYKLPDSIDEMCTTWHNAPPEAIVNFLGGEVVSSLETAILNVTGMKQHVSELMYLILTHALEYHERFRFIIQENEKATYRIAFAKIVLAVNDINGTFDASFKVSSKGKVQNAILSKILKTVLKNALTLNNTPFYDLGLDYLDQISEDGKIDLTKIEKVAKSKPQRIDVLQGQLKTQLPLEFCLSLLPFLNGETGLKKEKETNFSDRQLSFLFELCKHLGYEPFKHKEFLQNDYKQSDFLRGALGKYVKKLKTKGNQNRFSFKV